MKVKCITSRGYRRIVTTGKEYKSFGINNGYQMIIGDQGKCVEVPADRFEKINKKSEKTSRKL